MSHDNASLAVEFDPDLADAGVRTLFHDGRDPRVLAETMPLRPLLAPGLPKLPPSLVDQALFVGDPPAAAAPKRKKKVYVPGPRLWAIVRNALYRDETPIRVVRPDGKEQWQNVLPGRLHGGTDFGPTQRDLVIVGKCLGVAEAEARRPFVGSGSTPLWDAWTEVGLSDPKGWVYETNLVRFVPGTEQATRLPAAWVADGTYLLYQELMLVRPKWILALGADALKAVLAGLKSAAGGKTKVTLDSCRGLIVPLTLDLRATADDEPREHHVRVVAANHPAAVARDPETYPLLRASLRQLAQHAAGDLPVTARAVAVPREITDYRMIYTFDDLAREVATSVQASADGGYVAFDCEWHGRHPANKDAFLYTVQWSHAPGHARCVFLRRHRGAANPELPADGAAALLTVLLAGARGRGARLVAHFGKGDLVWLKHFGVDLFDHYLPPADDPGMADYRGVGPRPFCGHEKTWCEGPFDTYYALHATEETQKLQLEVAANMLLGVERWDGAKERESDRVCAEEGWSKRELPGYGLHREEVLGPYACGDADHAGRLYLHLNGDPRQRSRGTLDRDRFGNCCRNIFHSLMAALPAWAEMEDEGILVDLEAHRGLRERFAAKRAELIAELRASLGWPDLDLAKLTHRIELFYGEEHHGRGRKRPDGALTLGLEPFKSTDATGGRLWAEAWDRYRADKSQRPQPSTDKEAVADARAGKNEAVELVYKIDILTTALKNFLRPPDTPEQVAARTKRRQKARDKARAAADPFAAVVPAEPADPAEEGEEDYYSRGILQHLRDDGRVASLYGLAETDRTTSSQPNLQNQVSEGADDKYTYILGEPVKGRTIFVSRPGCWLVNADLKLAEVAVAAWTSGDKLLIEHVERANLPGDHPDYIDLHADLAVRSFKLDCAATKAGLKKVGKGHLRTAAKRTRFGHYYGAAPETLLRKIREEPDAQAVTLEDVLNLVKGHDEAYPALASTLEAAMRRAREPGWMCGPYGSYRRSRLTPQTDRDLVGRVEREFRNFLFQNPVAVAVHRWLAEIRRERARLGLTFKIVLSVHDSVMLEVPFAEAEAAVDAVLVPTIRRKVPFIPCDLNGLMVPGRGPYYFGVDVSVGPCWEGWLEEDEWRKQSREARAAN